MSSRIVTEAEVISVPAVPYTETFRPVHHKDVIAVMRRSIKDMGLEIANSQYTVSRGGMQFFGVWDLSNSNSEMCWSVGIRNSMDKSLALGIVAGTRVLVCSNLAFSGDYIEFRKHTKGLDNDELEYLAFKSIRRMVHQLTEFQAWHEGLKQHFLPETDAKLLLVDVLSRGVFPPSKFSRFHDLYFTRENEPSLFSFHECCTNVLRGSNLLVLPKRNKILNNVIEDYISRGGEKISSLGDFYENRAASIINLPSRI